MENRAKRIDSTLLFVFIALVFIGFIMIYSSSAVLAYENYNDSAYFLKKQILFAIIALFISIIFFRMPEEKLKKIAPVLLYVSIAFLILIFIPGFSRKIGGAKRWLKFLFLPPFQPLEFIKLFLVMYLAYIYSNDKLTEKTKIFRTLFIVGLICFNLFFQPDMGGIIIILLITISMMIISVHLIKYLILILPGIIFFVYWLIKLEPYRVKRLFVFLNPWKDPYGAGFQTIQSFIGIGSGGIFGVGLTQSQQKFLFLPTPHTDYIFSIIGEEFGFLGCFVIVFIFFLICWRGLHISLNINDKFLKFLSAGITIMICMQAFINIGVTVGLLPAKGITLPFLSYGGSSLLVSITAASILLSISGKLYD